MDGSRRSASLLVCRWISVMNASNRDRRLFGTAPTRLQGLLVFLALLIAGLWMGSPAPAAAYSTPDAYAATPISGGGGGRWFTGSPAEGFDCGICHIESPSQTHFPFYVTGLPLEGYELATTREVVVSWPEFAARWREVRGDPMAPLAEGAPSPAMGLVAELVAESGKASGTIEIDAKSAAAGEFCEQTRANLQPRLAAVLYQVRPGLEPLLIKPDSTGVMRCDVRQLGQRCLIAMTSCGASVLRFRWTPPPSREGPIWFSSGFVATDALSGTFDQDSFQQISVPMLSSDSAGGAYQRVLSNGCTVSATPREASLYCIGLIACIALAIVFRQRRLR